MEVTRVEQRTYIKIAVLRDRNGKECHSELVETLGNNALIIPYSSAVGRKVSIKEPIHGRRFVTRKNISNAVRQQVTRFTLDAANADAYGIQCLPHRWQRVVTVAGSTLRVFRPSL
ncbi:uncharacterized protein TNCV_4972771 [Trichonephila clavipes]|nr:uncharacterized protein TNCV_4972771 [Trichonephila clavipes]